MEVASKIKSVKDRVIGLISNGVQVFFRKNPHSEKSDINFKAVRIMMAIGIFIFIAVIFLLPTEVPIEFSQKIEPAAVSEDRSDENTPSSHGASAQTLWASTPPVGGHQVNYNTAMIIGPNGGNAKTQLRSGIRLSLRILDKVIVSQDPVPVSAELILDSQSESGLKLSAGAKLYGEASFQKGSDRALIHFSQISLPSGQIRSFHAIALGKDGQPGVVGRIFSDGIKNTVGQVLTTFVGGLATGSMQTDILGNSSGGLQNGLLGAVAQTAQSRAQAYGEKLKTEREWIEVNQDTECNAVLNESFSLQQGGDAYE